MNKQQRWLAAILAALGISVAGAVVASADDVAFTSTVQSDTVRVIGSWAPRCDVRGCPDSFIVEWLVGGVSRVKRTVSIRVDTVKAPVEALAGLGDSIEVTLSVIAVRKGVPSQPKSVTRWVQLPKVAPPPVDSIKIDSIVNAAARDSFPLGIVVRDSMGVAIPGTGSYLRIGTETQRCVLAWHKYERQAVIMEIEGATPDDRTAMHAACERARAQYSAERGG